MYQRRLKSKADVRVALLYRFRHMRLCCHASAYRYGVGEDTNATWDDLPRIMLQMEENPNFLSERCSHVEDVSFSFDWSQRELFGMEMEEPI